MKFCSRRASIYREIRKDAGNAETQSLSVSL